ncbi:MAG: hydrogenase maturation protease [Candidatus Omnitrophica bacterium]|nr:hydrogenase maturation protease [Candidatus Omnitrophota bacterium]
MLRHLKSHLCGKVVILGIGNTLSSDDGAGSILAGRIKDNVPYTVYDAGVSPENYLGKIIKDKPDNIIIIDAVDFRAKPGDCTILEGKDIKTANLFATHNASISLTISYLQNNLQADIIVLAIQPKTVAFGDKVSKEIEEALVKLEEWFGEAEEKR